MVSASVAPHPRVGARTATLRPLATEEGLGAPGARNCRSVGHDGEAGFARVLGPVQVVRADGRVADPGSSTQRRLLAVLALAAPRSVRKDRLCDVLGLSPSALRTSVSRLRRTAGGGVVTTTTGYRLDVPVDATLLCRELAEGARDADVIERVLARWGGPAVEEFAGEPWAVGEAARLDEIRANAVEDRAEALVDARRAGEAVAALDGQVVDHPYRDRSWGLLIRALAASGRQADALRAFQRYRETLADEVGTAPSDDVRAIERRVAAGWDGTAAPAGRSHPPEPASPPAADLPPALAADVPFVGRASELAALEEAFRSVRAAGTLRAVTLVGEAGIGKTSLLAALARATVDRATVVYGRCDETATAPLQPFRAVVGALAARLPPEVLVAHVESHGGVLLRLAPRLARRVEVREPVSTDDTTAQFVLLEAVADLLERAARAAPLVVLLDDVHWADAGGLHLLRHLAVALAASPVLLVVSLRPPDEEPTGPVRSALAELARAAVRRVDLAGLDADDIDALARVMLGDDAVADDAGDDRIAEVAAHLGRETAGNPLFATQLVRHWIAEGRMGADGDALRLVPGTAVPATLRDIVLHRVGALGPSTRTVLEAASVLGVEFAERSVQQMVDLPVTDVDAAIAAATRAGLLVDAGPGRVRFAHALVASVVATGPTGARRRALHERAARAMVKDDDLLGPARPAALAHHFEQAALLPEALRWATAAGDEALDHLSPAEAVGWYRRASAHADRLGCPADLRADLVVRRGEAEVRAGEPSGLATLLEGAELARRVGATGALVHAALASDCGIARLGRSAPDQLRLVEWALEAGQPDPTERAHLLALLGQSLVHTEQGPRREAAAREALELARAGSDRSLLARIAPAALHALWLPGATAVRTELAREAVESAERTGDPYLTYLVHAAAFNAAITSGDARGARRSDARRRDLVGVAGDRGRWVSGVVDTFVHTMAARFADAERVLDETLRLGTRIGETDAFGMYAGQLYVLRTFQGRHAEMLPFVEKLLHEDTRKVELPFRLAYGIACSAVGREDVARGLLDDGVAAGFGHVSQDVLWMTTIVGYAVLAIELAHIDAARLLYPVLAPYAAEVSFNGSTSQGPIAAYLGKLASLIGDHDAAHAHLCAALAMADAFGWTYHRATTLYALAEARLRRTGRLDAEALAALDEAESICRTVGIANWAERAASLRATAL